MMPRALVAQPADPVLANAISSWRKKTTKSRIAERWKSFRSGKEGRYCFAVLTKQYGERCVYCDHCPARTVDHLRSKLATVASAFSWSNWAPACGDCNRNKGNHALVSPFRGDPRSSFQIDVTTGLPVAVGPPSRRTRNEKSIRAFSLDSQTIADARRRMRQEVLLTMKRFLEGDAQESDVLAAR